MLLLVLLVQAHKGRVTRQHWAADKGSGEQHTLLWDSVGLFFSTHIPHKQTSGPIEMQYDGSTFLSFLLRHAVPMRRCAGVLCRGVCWNTG
jgi:hypothetical protein